MAEKPSDGEAKGQGWWDSIPGMLKAVAGVVTAVTGLLVVFHQLGWLGRGADAEPAAMEPHSAGAAAATRRTTARRAERRLIRRH